MPDAWTDAPSTEVRLSGPATEPEPPSVSCADLSAQVDNLKRGLATRTVVGQAQGILIERHKITADDAFRMLVTASSVTNRKLRDVAEELVTTGALPAFMKRR